MPSAWPTLVAAAPSAMNTTLNPRMKAMELIITRRKSWDCADFNSSTPTPEIMETYPGTSGSTQGDTNETRPPRNASMTRVESGRFDIGLIYCTCCTA